VGEWERGSRVNRSWQEREKGEGITLVTVPAPFEALPWCCFESGM